MHTINTWQGLPPGRTIHHVGMLDLRGTVPERIAQVEEIHTVDVLLLEEETRALLQPTSMHHVGSILVAAPDERVLVTPQLELSRSGIEGLTPGQKILVMGNVFFKPDVPAALVAEKFESLRIFGALIACSGVLGVLIGKMQHLNGVTLALPDEVGPIYRAHGETRMTNESLAGLAPGTTYINIGNTQIDSVVFPELLREKVAAYYNVGKTSGPNALMAVLQFLCPVNLGHFQKS
jgi:hypothetical protein